MKKFFKNYDLFKNPMFCFIAALFIGLPHIYAQDAAALAETGRKFANQKDYDNAILVFKSAIKLAPNNIDYQTDLTNAYYYKGDYTSAKDLMEKLLKNDGATEQVYYLAYNIYAQNEEVKNAEKAVKAGLAKYKKSGLLYNCYGEILYSKKDVTCIVQWENGIEADPNYSSNYYNASKYYYGSNFIMAKIWSIYYGEIFINLENFSSRSIELKSIIFDSYKLIFTDETIWQKKTKNDFEIAFIDNMKNQKEVMISGVTTANLIMLRTRFVLSWFNNKTFFESALYTKQQQLLKEGFFEEYNYWLFESIQDVDAFERWTNLHKASYAEFNRYTQNRIFKIGENEYYKLKN
jgi:Tfp pilus assembly protein PilF